MALLCATPSYALTPETSRHMERGRELFEYGRWSDARHEFRQARAELAPTDHAAIQETDYYLAACAVELGSADAAAALQAFERNYPGSTYLNDVRFALASFYCGVGNFDRAAEVFRTVDRAALSVSRREQYDFRMGYLAFNDGDYTEMYNHLERIPANSELADHAAYYKAYVDYIEGRTGRALDGFGQLSKSETYGDVAPYFLLQLAFRDGDYGYILEHGDALAAQATPARKAEIERIVAETWFRQEKYDAAIAHLQNYFAAGGESIRETAYLMGFSLYRLEHY
ncbi:MAG: hypothetical protein K2H25_04980, partial [Alistipes sp.]|nr:hypothetical protein [Alistipes sp.]